MAFRPLAKGHTSGVEQNQRVGRATVSRAKVGCHDYLPAKMSPVVFVVTGKGSDFLLGCCLCESQ